MFLGNAKSSHKTVARNYMLMLMGPKLKLLIKEAKLVISFQYRCWLNADILIIGNMDQRCSK